MSIRSVADLCLYVLFPHNAFCRQAGGLNSLLKMAYFANSGVKEKRIGVPFAPSQNVIINSQVSSTMSPFASTTAAADGTKEAGASVSRDTWFHGVAAQTGIGGAVLRVNVTEALFVPSVHLIDHAICRVMFRNGRQRRSVHTRKKSRVAASAPPVTARTPRRATPATAAAALGAASTAAPAGPAWTPRTAP
jgi:hypothetical protein